MHFSKSLATACLAVVPFAAPAETVELTQYNLDPHVTVSGLSSGAFMTVQLQTAFSEAVSGVGVVAGGPFNCAGADIYSSVMTEDTRAYTRILQATSVCLNPTEKLPYLPLTALQTGAMKGQSEATIKHLTSIKGIDDPKFIKDDRIYLFHGSQDPIVRDQTMDVLRDMYTELGVPDAQIEYDIRVPAGHSFVTELGDVPCSDTEPDYLNKCPVADDPAKGDVDQAKDILTHLYGPLNPPVAPIDANFMSFDQSAYAQDVMGMDNDKHNVEAYLYVPDACQSGQTTCHLHIAIHGCEQGRYATLPDGKPMGDRYATLTGYNGWAEANNIVVLYPQALAVPSAWYVNLWNMAWFGTKVNNPKGCWDWWGYGGDDYLSKDAPQMAAIASMAAALGAPLTTAK
ncbi:hypothetical protein HJ526_18765 [Donghicola sp. C2-DW-16]|uniref:Poly(3-hydroxybutyrate) depolymerase n=1 Tax=Donghicola mangrovi TaxID=2729614 RepID=A0ABX2PJ17_9RHOB|nr:hypothetical protein [Donghicola mangrovi]NVO29469.1 hypothetical protein [Donghicola mangrovi]